MKPLKISEILRATGGKLHQGDENYIVEKVCQDSRVAEKGTIFFALRTGGAFDGHDYVKSAMENGCKAVVVQDLKSIEDIAEELNVIYVDDTVKALQDLAKWYLDQLNPKKIAITGSTGKTSTRDMTYYVCNEKFKTQKNQGNFNSFVGVPLTILEFDEDIEVAVLEMGMDRPGEIDSMVDIARPEIALITNIGVSHLERFGNDRKGIFDAKLEIVNYFDESSTLIVTDSQEYLNEEYIREHVKGDFKLIMTGDKENDEYFVSDIDQSSDEGVKFKVTAKGETGEFFIPVLGRHNALNAALAIAAGAKIGVTFEEAARGLAKMELTGKRLAIKTKDGIKVIDDTYNASPASMKAALDILSKTEGERKIAILGDMYELGEDEVMYHKEIGEIARAVADEVFSIGELGKNISSENNFASAKEFNEKMNGYFKSGDVVLVKASRGMALEKIVEDILK